jgi:hypothetical protein
LDWKKQASLQLRVLVMKKIKVLLPGCYRCDARMDGDGEEL